ncbi:MAG: DNA/RNA non-specific endonuclease [Candidatus Latescibacteria bacterium]|nr:DNA/RNA non-specific endonuclease [Candidatus Latescibacterota bacterium]
MKLFLRCIFLVFIISCGHEPSVEQVQTGHFFFGQPQGTPETNNLIERSIYALSSNDDRKMADWVCYRLNVETVDGKVKTSRRWKVDPLLLDHETLEPSDYKDASAVLKVDRGHQAPLASFKGTAHWKETNYLSNVTPQKSNLNQGPWRILEERVRVLVRKVQVVWVMTGPLFERTMPILPHADEPHQVPSGYWKIICVQDHNDLSDLKVTAFIFEQETSRKSAVLNHQVSVDEIEKRSGLNFMHELPIEFEQQIEAQKNIAWAALHF